ncbi:patatin-like phospholipase family protein [Flavilitoribacter nigricans]|uniref:patatin-like phospholipase family protein n=1 Tax=Flavilitoribacter nigricans TaxID=70997 RepID=UPI00117B7C1A|nr:patatin-like phospholipase family protein [Flavilitoribacter nigricans]
MEPRAVRRSLADIWFSFPVQLLILHLRSNLLLIGSWIVLLLMLTGNMGRKLGLQYLFLDPEYLGEVNFWSFFFIGLAYGGFFMSWNLTTYLLSAQYFPFLATLSRPFTKFSLNNALIPLGFFVYYLVVIINFQAGYEKLSLDSVFLNGLGLLFGGLTLVSFYSIYFNYTNRDISYYKSDREMPPNLAKPIAPGRRRVDLDYIKLDNNRWKVKTYLNEAFQPRLVRSVAHYEARMLMNIFRQNHLNALLLQLITMVILLILGYLIDVPLFRIPAGASIFILMSVLIAILGAFIYWFGEWMLTIFVLLLVFINFVTSFEVFDHRNRAYGLDYLAEPVTYSYDTLESICYSDQVQLDKQETTRILDKWRLKMEPHTEGKPKMVILSVSGGGLKAATWTVHVAQTIDSLMGGQFLDQTVLVTGASGGMLGMAYLRELMLREKSGDSVNLYDQEYLDNIGKDLLNSVAFTIITNDVFLPWSRFEYRGNVYTKDRGYIFEQQLNENTDSILDKPLWAYHRAEAEARIPMIYLTPSIINDGRRLIISPQGVSFMMVAPVGLQKPESVEVDAVDFGWLFKHQGASELRFLSALRMNATYPYVLPTVHLPSDPSIEVIDAGLRDNYGILSATRFIQVFTDWIRENTSGVVLVQISSAPKIEEVAQNDGSGVIGSLFNPIGIAGKVFDLQEFEHDNSLGFIYDLLGPEQFEVVRFTYKPTGEYEAAVSFHITDGEKKDVLNAISLEENQESLRTLLRLLGKDGPLVSE